MTSTTPQTADSQVPERRTGTVLAGIVSIDRTRLESPAQQIYSAIACAVQDGTLPPGTRLPTVRALAAEADVAVNTVAKAFRRLGDSGLVITRGRAGTVIAPLDTVTSRLEQAARTYAEAAAHLGFGAHAATELVEKAFTDLTVRG